MHKPVLKLYMQPVCTLKLSFCCNCSYCPYGPLKGSNVNPKHVWGKKTPSLLGTRMHFKGFSSLNQHIIGYLPNVFFKYDFSLSVTISQLSKETLGEFSTKTLWTDLGRYPLNILNLKKSEVSLL